MSLKTRTSLFDYESRSQQDKQIRVLRDIVQESLNPFDRNNEILQDLLPKETYSSKEKVLNTYFKLKLPSKNVLEVERENTDYMRNIMENYSKQRYMNAQQGLIAPPEPPLLSMKNVRSAPVYTEEEGCRMYSYIQEEHIQVQWNKEVGRQLFFREFTTSESVNIYSLLISVLKRCETLGFSQAQIGAAIVLTCQEIMKDFKSTIITLTNQGCRIMLQALMDQTSEKQEMDKIFKRLKELKRSPEGETGIKDLIRSLKINYFNFFSIKNPEVKDAQENLKKSEDLSLINIMDFFSPSGIAAIRREVAAYEEKMGKKPSSHTFISYL